MKSRSADRKKGRLADAHTRDSITALLGIAVVVVAAIGACSLDPKNPPLPNEAPNRGQFVGGIAIGAGAPTGTGGSGAGLGTGGTSTTLTNTGGGGNAPPYCACSVEYSLGDNCFGCFNSVDNTTCVVEENNCTADMGNPSCTALFQSLLSCGGSASCVKSTLASGSTNTAFENLLQCDCTACAGACAGSSC
jgi:hypothetical protein